MIEVKTLEVDLNKLSDNGVLRFLKLKQEVEKIKIQEDNKNWMDKPQSEPLPDFQQSIPQPPQMMDDSGYDDEDEDMVDDEDTEN